MRKAQAMDAAEYVAAHFHEAYERLAPTHGWETQERTQVSWADVPADNKLLMIHVAAELLERHVIEVPRERLDLGN